MSSSIYNMLQAGESYKFSIRKVEQAALLLGDLVSDDSDDSDEDAPM